MQLNKRYFAFFIDIIFPLVLFEFFNTSVFKIDNGYDIIIGFIWTSLIYPYICFFLINRTIGMYLANYFLFNIKNQEKYIISPEFGAIRHLSSIVVFVIGLFIPFWLFLSEIKLLNLSSNEENITDKIWSTHAQSVELKSSRNFLNKFPKIRLPELKISYTILSLGLYIILQLFNFCLLGVSFSNPCEYCKIRLFLFGPKLYSINLWPYNIDFIGSFNVTEFMIILIVPLILFLPMLKKIKLSK